MNERKIKFVADTASDIPDELLREYGIDMPSVPITVDGVGYFERKSFSIREFYEVLAKSEEIPVTSRVPAADYLEIYKRAWNEGYTDIISVTINAGGSATNESSHMAAAMLYDEIPEARGKINIHVVDSKTYTMAYGYPTVEAAKMARAGSSVEEILEYLRDWFDRMEVYLVCYTLEYARKSGRITAASAIVGDALGLRPIISMIDGKTTTIEKVRGDKVIPVKLLTIYRQRSRSRDDPILVVQGEADEYGLEMKALLEQEQGREVPLYNAGASIVINAGPRIVAICMLGEKRSQQS